MLEITNREKTPIQLLIRSKNVPRGFACKNLPGTGMGQNVYYLADERTTEYIDRLKNENRISVRYIPNNTGKGK